jgi:hypothetical protein
MWNSATVGRRILTSAQVNLVAATPTKLIASNHLARNTVRITNQSSLVVKAFLVNAGATAPTFGTLGDDFWDEIQPHDYIEYAIGDGLDVYAYATLAATVRVSEII